MCYKTLLIDKLLIQKINLYWNNVTRADLVLSKWLTLVWKWRTPIIQRVCRGTRYLHDGGGDKLEWCIIEDHPSCWRRAPYMTTSRESHRNLPSHRQDSFPIQHLSTFLARPKPGIVSVFSHLALPAILTYNNILKWASSSSCAGTPVCLWRKW